MTAVEPGWHDDPEDALLLRYWDGTAWTEHRSAKQIPPPPPVGPASGAATFGTKGSAEHWALPVGRSGWAIAAGYLGLLSLIMLPAPFAVVAGVLGLRQISRDPHLGGKGRAWFGIVMGSGMMLLWLGLTVTA